MSDSMLLLIHLCLCSLLSLRRVILICSHQSRLSSIVFTEYITGCRRLKATMAEIKEILHLKRNGNLCFEMVSGTKIWRMYCTVKWISRLRLVNNANISHTCYVVIGYLMLHVVIYSSRIHAVMRGLKKKYIFQIIYFYRQKLLQKRVNSKCTN